MKSTTLALGSMLVAAVFAQPHRHQQHHHQKRDVVWVTDYDYVTETVGVTTTIWVSSGFVPPTTSSEAAATSSASEVPAEFFQPQQKASSSSVYVAPTPSTSSTSSVYVAPTPSSTYVAPAPSSSEAPAYVAPAAAVESSSSPAPAYVPETTSAAPVYVAPTTSAAPAPVATTASSSSSGSSSGECSSGSPCTGDITYYTAGLGACGITSDGDTENVVALPHGLMGTQSNGNPYCGKTITVKCSATGKTTTATVVDKCMGCDAYSIDLSNAAFLELDDLSVGRTTAEWWFN